MSDFLVLQAVRLLRAMLTSKTALTDVFISRLEDRSSPRKMHIFVKFPSSTKSITVEVAGSDTIATVKSRINAKVTIPEGCRHELVYGSTRLEDLSTVAEYNIINECTISSEFLKK